MERKTTQISLRLDPELFEAIDRARGQVPRERWVRELVIAAVALPDGPMPSAPRPSDAYIEADNRDIRAAAIPPSPSSKRVVDMSRQERLNKAKQKGKP